MAFTGASLEQVKNLIYKVKRDGEEISDEIERQLQNNVINLLADNWFSEEAVTYLGGFRENIMGKSYEIAVNINKVVEIVARAYDTWLDRTRYGDDEDEAEVAWRYSHIHFSPDLQYRSTDPTDKDNKPLNIKYTYGGDSREYSYLSSEDTKIDLNVSNVYATTQDGDMSIGANVDMLETVRDNVSTIKENIRLKVREYQSSLKNSAAFMDRESRQMAAVSNFYDKVMESIDNLFNYLTENQEGCTCLQTKLTNIIEKYSDTISGNIARGLENAEDE